MEAYRELIFGQKNKKKSIKLKNVFFNGIFLIVQMKTRAIVLKNTVFKTSK